jgi:hypothetical protein
LDQHKKICVGPRPDIKGEFQWVDVGCNQEYSRHAYLILHWRIKHSEEIILKTGYRK